MRPSSSVLLRAQASTYRGREQRTLRHHGDRDQTHAHSAALLSSSSTPRRSHSSNVVEYRTLRQSRLSPSSHRRGYLGPKDSTAESLEHLRATFGAVGSPSKSPAAGGSPAAAPGSPSIALDGGGVAMLYLRDAASRGDERAVAAALDSEEVDIDDVGETGRTLLHRAAERGHEAVIQLLTDRGADTAAATHPGADTPLHLACGGGHLAAVRTLLEHSKSELHAVRFHLPRLWRRVLDASD
jgi:hypothetical protein